MKRVYTLTAIFSAAAAVLLIIDLIVYINEGGRFYFNFYRDPLIAILMALCTLSVVQLKMRTPRLMLVLCGYVFISSSIGFGYSYLGYGFLGTLLLMAAALTPAIYEFSRYGLMVRQEPNASGQGRWRWLLTATIALTIYRILLFIMQTVVGNYDSLDNFLGNRTADIMGISALICFAVFCGLMDRRTSALYRMFFTGCILFDAVQTVFPLHGSTWGVFSMDPIKTLFVFFEVLYALFILLILMHALFTRRDGLITQEHTEVTRQAETPAA